MSALRSPLASGQVKSLPLLCIANTYQNDSGSEQGNVQPPGEDTSLPDEDPASFHAPAQRESIGTAVHMILTPLESDTLKL
jgi:hypothetical protein